MTNSSKCKIINVSVMRSNKHYVSIARRLLQKNCSKQVCRRCHNRHDDLLHINVHTQPNDWGLTKHNRCADARDNPTADVTTYSSFKGKSQNQILLATAIAELWNKSVRYIPYRALLDNASQSYFRKQSLRLSKTRDTFFNPGHQQF